ncbi:hypothetical protein ACFRR7_14935 [Streptomyces sp. NPDC056909]|uniref:hypothetical protein n=1 Tax=Streptomyces sp. NPDC056909 TaxID=3345963 RepID=UPI003673DEC2
MSEVRSYNSPRAAGFIFRGSVHRAAAQSGGTETVRLIRNSEDGPSYSRELRKLREEGTSLYFCALREIASHLEDPGVDGPGADGPGVDGLAALRPGPTVTWGQAEAEPTAIATRILLGGRELSTG